MTHDSNFPDVFRGHLWHTTHPDRFQKILEAGAILPNPPIPDDDRWKTSRGPHYYPYVRTLGGVSLFDFEDFDPVRYSTGYPMSSWRAFVPYSRQWGISVWIEIDRQLIADKFVTGKQLVERWNREKAHAHTIMPEIEAAYFGPVRLSAFRRALVCGVNRPSIQEISLNPTEKLHDCSDNEA